MNTNEKKFFKTLSSGGYDPTEVDGYIQQLEQKLQTQKVMNNICDGQVSKDFLLQFETMKSELAIYHEIEGKLKNALEAAHKATENIQEIVESESRRILYEANQNADEIVKQALDQSIIALNFIKQMKIDARVFQKRLSVLHNAQQDFIDNNVWNEVLAPIAPYEFINIASIDDIANADDESEEHII